MRSARTAFILGILAMTVLAEAAEKKRSPAEDQAVVTVANAMSWDGGLYLTARDLVPRAPPRGDGVYVHINRKHPQAVWIYLDGKAYAMNGLAKSLTPNLEYAGVPAFQPGELERRGVAPVAKLLEAFYGN